MKYELSETTFQRIWLQLRWKAARLGTIGKIGVGLLVLSGAFFLAAVLPQNANLQELKDRATAMQVESRQTQNNSTSAGKLSGDQALQIFYEFFPQVDSSPFWIRELVRVAKKRKVKINSSEYRLVREPGSRLARYEMTLPVRGQYSQIRAFIADALQVVPAMAIVGITIEREQVQVTQLAVRLEINLYLNE